MSPMIEPIQIEHNQHFVTETTTSAGTTEELEYIYPALNISELHCTPKYTYTLDPSKAGMG